MGSSWQTAFVGHLSQESLAAALAPCPVDVARVLFDCTNMTGYDLATRHSFVEWNRARPKLERVAIITDNALWHMVVGAMSLASGRTMRCFASLEAGQAWLEGL